MVVEPVVKEVVVSLPARNSAGFGAEQIGRYIQLLQLITLIESNGRWVGRAPRKALRGPKFTGLVCHGETYFLKVRM